MKRLNSIDELTKLSGELAAAEDPDRVVVTLCGGTGCTASGSGAVKQAFLEELEKRDLAGNIDVKITGCHGFCEQGPVCVILPRKILYRQITEEDVAEIVEKTLMQDEVVERLLWVDPQTGEKIVYDHEIPFYGKQERRILRDNGLVDPTDPMDYIGRGGYASLAKVLSGMSADEVINEVENSGIRGRGGAGFPTGRKWRFTRASPGNTKYLVCNADEGDPGAFMDRSLLEGNTHLVVEGMIIGAFAIGSNQGYVYARAEYPLAVKNLGKAIEDCKKLGLLGDNILGTDFSFHLKIKEGAGAFVCGEETALLASIEGKRGMPRARPPFPAQSGLDGCPTNINNVETFANIPLIIRDGAEGYAQVGTEESKGTKIFSLTGKINNTGLVEVPIGTPMREVIFGIGGGIPKGRKFKAVQMGGPSGGCVPEQYLDLPIDYGSLQKIGAIMGSGGMIVMDENTCMVDMARFFLAFTQSESCGKCTPCRLGTKHMLNILTRITKGEGRMSDLDILRKIAGTVQDCSLCGLGQTCPKPVLSTIQYFSHEYEAHIRDKRCPAAVCDAMMISPCQHTCPVGINVPLYVAAIADGDYDRSVEIIRERNPFPAICGRICHHPCEVKCRRGELDDPVAIRSLKRFAADHYFNNSHKPPEPFSQTRSNRVAVVGAGPTGLTCAYYLARIGYPVTVFEALPVGGGMLSVGVPAFRLPLDVIESEIDYIRDCGVEIRYNSPVNVNFTIETLMKEGYESVFIGAGTQKSQNIGIPGEVEGLTGLMYGLSFLRDVKQGKGVSVGSRVAVIGGGNTAVDSARTALRLGAEKVEVYYRRSREEMPVTDIEYEEAVAEGVEFHFLTSPTRVLSERWRVSGLQCIRMRLGQADESGRRRPIPVQGSEFTVEMDTVIPAVGQAPDLSFLPADSKLERTKWEMLSVDPDNLATNIPGVFAGGDFVTGPSFVIKAIAAGRRGAVAIDKYLRKDTSRVELYDLKEAEPPRDKTVDDLQEDLGDRPRVEMPVRPPKKRVRSFEEIEMGFSETQARQEARRCLRCDLEK